MNRKKIKVWCICSGCIAVLLLLLWVYYGAVFGEKKSEEKAEISVVLYHAGTNGWESLMQGMKQAEEDFPVTINYVTAKADATGEEQKELVLREIANGAEGILLAAADETILYEEISRENERVPVITIENDTSDRVCEFIAADYPALGRELGQEILRDFQEQDNIDVLVVQEAAIRDSEKEMLQGLTEVLGEETRIITVNNQTMNTSYQPFLEGAIRASHADAVVVLCKETLQELCSLDSSVLEGKLLYGVGNTPAIVSALDSGKIHKLIFQNEFNMGYLSVERILQVLRGTKNAEPKAIEFYCVTREEMYETQYERLLFPIIE